MITARTHTLTLALLTTNLVACEPALDACESAMEHDASVELGMGENNFQQVEDGDEVPFHSGMQGGQHIYGAVLTTGMVTGRDLLLGGVDDGAEVNFTVRVEEIEFGWGGSDATSLNGNDEEAERVGEFIYVEFWDLFDSMDDETLEAYAEYDYYEDELDATIEVEVTDSCGTTATDTHEVVLYAY